MRTAIPESRATALVVGLMLAACAGDEGPRSDGEGGDGIGSLSDTGGPGSGEGGDDDDGGSGDDALDSGDDDGGPAFDIGSGEAGEGGETGAEGCQRVDFLFIVDNSASMEDQQAALVAAFPAFMDAITATLTADNDYHVLVTDTDEWGRCNTANPWNGSDPGSDLCNNYIKNTAFEECDRTLGAGVLHPAGKFATNAPCAFAGGDRWTGPDEPDLGSAFACAAQVGVAGHPSERPMDSLVAAVEVGINQAGGCNEGFMRDDALLVVTFMSDDPNYEDANGPDEWYQAVVDAKGGDPSRVVVLGLTPAWPGCMDGNNGAIKGAHWAEFIGKWGDHGLHGNICGTADDFVTFFESAVSTIDTACDEFEPPG